MNRLSRVVNKLKRDKPLMKAIKAEARNQVRSLTKVCS